MKLASTLSASFLSSYSAKDLQARGYDVEGAGWFAQIKGGGDFEALDIVVSPSLVSSREDRWEWIVGFYNFGDEDGSSYLMSVSTSTEEEARTLAQKNIDAIRDLLQMNFIAGWPDAKKWDSIFALLGIESV